MSLRYSKIFLHFSWYTSLSLADKLEKTPQREVAGSDAYAAFEFQLMFGVELLFEQFDKLNDFAVLFEFHDDIVWTCRVFVPPHVLV